jgi:hypothetical protein
MAHVVKLDDIWSMLDDCAPGHTRKASQHYWAVTFGGKTYRSLPLGPHGRRHNPDVEAGHVRSLIRHLDISTDCAKKHVNVA